MSKVFYDHLIVLDDLEVVIKENASSEEERHELWQIVDELVHHKVIGCILDELPEDHHDEFLEKFHNHPHDDRLINYLKERVEKDIEEIIKLELSNLSSEILRELQLKK